MTNFRRDSYYRERLRAVHPLHCWRPLIQSVILLAVLVGGTLAVL